MFDTIFWAVIGTLSGVIFGVIPGAGPFVATATLYPFLTHIEPVNVMMYYITVLIATNYTNSVTAILYGIPCLLYTSPSPRDAQLSRMPSSA